MIVQVVLKNDTYKLFVLHLGGSFFRQEKNYTTVLGEACVSFFNTMSQSKQVNFKKTNTFFIHFHQLCKLKNSQRPTHVEISVSGLPFSSTIDFR